MSKPNEIRDRLEIILDQYGQARASEPFGTQHPLWETFRGLQRELAERPAVRNRPHLRVTWSGGKGSWAKIPYVAFFDMRETRSTQRGVYGALLFRQDLSGVYLALTQGMAEPRRQLGSALAQSSLQKRASDLRNFGQELPKRGFRLDDLIDLRTQPDRSREYEAATIAYKLYEAGEVPRDSVLLKDVDAVLAAYERYVRARRSKTIVPGAAAVRETRRHASPPPFQPESATEALIEWIERRNFVFEPWQIAAYVAALRTKPFAILAGVSGTGKSKLPKLVAEATGGESTLIPVRPDWTDSAEVLGYADLGGSFRPGAVLAAAREAEQHPRRHHVCILDEMNLARTEHFFAEVLSRIEDRHAVPRGGFASAPLLAPTAGGDAEWSAIGLPPNLALVGTVNMDESAHGFSRKVLDRAFTLELSDVDLGRWEATAFPEGGPPERPAPWPVDAWQPYAVRLGELPSLTPSQRMAVAEAVAALEAVNPWLAPAGLQAGYRTRDEMALFSLHAREISGCFVARGGARVDPLDLALTMKVLPRIVGGSGAVRRAILGLLGWTRGSAPLQTEAEARAVLEAWDEAGRPGALPDARFPRTAARLCLMWERLFAEGFTSFWA